MSAIRLCVGCERKSDVFIIGLARKPLLLFRKRRRVRPEKGKSVESIAQRVIIHFSSLCPADGLPCFVEELQGKGVVGEVYVPRYKTWFKRHSSPTDLQRLFILSTLAINCAQIVVRCGFPRVVLDLF